MIGRTAHSRRAEQFDAAVSGRAHGAPERYAELLDVVDAMRAVPAPAARPEFVADLRSRLVTAAAEMPARRTDDATALRLTPRQRRGSRERRMAALLGGFAVVAASGSMALASQSALPGDTLYPVKRAIENAHANLESSPEAKAGVLLDNANTRLNEVEQLSLQSDAETGEISSTLQAFKDQSSQASALALDDFSSNGDSSALDAVHSFASSSMGRLDALDDVLPAGARPALVAAAQTVKSIDQAAYDACPTCTDGLVTQLPSFATQPLSAHLQAPLLGAGTTKSETATKGASAKPSGVASLPGLGEVLPSSLPSASAPSGGAPASAPPSTLPSGSPGLVGNTLNHLANDLLGTPRATASASSTTSSGSKNGTVVGGLTGLLGLGG